MIFQVINQTNKHKAKICNQCTYTLIIIIKKNYKNIRMRNLSLDELRLIAQIRNISDYENKSKEDLIKALSEPELTPKQKPETKQKPKPKPEIKINGKKLEEIEEDFYELRHKFSKKK